MANECAYQINPWIFRGYVAVIFANQNAINASNVREFLLSLGDGAAVDRQKLAACIDSKASLSRVEAGRQEGEELGVGLSGTLGVTRASSCGRRTAKPRKLISSPLRDPYNQQDG